MLINDLQSLRSDLIASFSYYWIRCERAHLLKRATSKARQLNRVYLITTFLPLVTANGTTHQHYHLSPSTSTAPLCRLRQNIFATALVALSSSSNIPWHWSECHHDASSLVVPLKSSNISWRKSKWLHHIASSIALLNYHAIPWHSLKHTAKTATLGLEHPTTCKANIKWCFTKSNSSKLQ